MSLFTTQDGAFAGEIDNKWSYDECRIKMVEAEKTEAGTLISMLEVVGECSRVRPR